MDCPDEMKLPMNKHGTFFVDSVKQRVVKNLDLNRKQNKRWEYKFERMRDLLLNALLEEEIDSVNHKKNSFLVDGFFAKLENTLGISNIENKV